jgi:hypothetical protein
MLPNLSKLSARCRPCGEAFDNFADAQAAVTCIPPGGRPVPEEAIKDGVECAICVFPLAGTARADPDGTRDVEALFETCGHVFHLECLRGWFAQRKSRCPSCRTDVTDAVLQRLGGEREDEENEEEDELEEYQEAIDAAVLSQQLEQRVLEPGWGHDEWIVHHFRMINHQIWTLVFGDGDDRFGIDMGTRVAFDASLELLIGTYLPAHVLGVSGFEQDLRRVVDFSFELMNDHAENGVPSGTDEWTDSEPRAMFVRLAKLVTQWAWRRDQDLEARGLPNARLDVLWERSASQVEVGFRRTGDTIDWTSDNNADFSLLRDLDALGQGFLRTHYIDSAVPEESTPEDEWQTHMEDFRRLMVNSAPFLANLREKAERGPLDEVGDELLSTIFYKLGAPDWRANLRVFFNSLARQATVAAREPELDVHIWAEERTERYDALHRLAVKLYVRVPLLRELFVRSDEVVSFRGDDGLERQHRPYELR